MNGDGGRRGGDYGMSGAARRGEGPCGAARRGEVGLGRLGGGGRHGDARGAVVRCAARQCGGT